jgi:hypothetical protein
MLFVHAVTSATDGGAGSGDLAFSNPIMKLTNLVTEQDKRLLACGSGQDVAIFFIFLRSSAASHLARRCLFLRSAVDSRTLGSTLPEAKMGGQ